MLGIFKVWHNPQVLFALSVPFLPFVVLDGKRCLAVVTLLLLSWLETIPPSSVH